MSCQEYEAQLGDYVDGTMDEAQRASFESHLPSCASCRAVVADFTVIRAATLSLEPRVPPPHVWRKLSAAIEAEPKPFFGVGGAQWWRRVCAGGRDGGPGGGALVDCSSAHIAAR